jgi:hypothetical protein
VPCRSALVERSAMFAINLCCWSKIDMFRCSVRLTKSFQCFSVWNWCRSLYRGLSLYSLIRACTKVVQGLSSVVGVCSSCVFCQGVLLSGCSINIFGHLVWPINIPGSCSGAAVKSCGPSERTRSRCNCCESESSTVWSVFLWLVISG